jgi:hypothetical protein
MLLQGRTGKQKQHLKQLALVVAPLMAVPSASVVATKVRKCYTITNSRESWTELEHDKFLEVLQL